MRDTAVSRTKLDSSSMLPDSVRRSCVNGADLEWQYPKKGRVKGVGRPHSVVVPDFDIRHLRHVFGYTTRQKRTVPENAKLSMDNLLSLAE